MTLNIIFYIIAFAVIVSLIRNISGIIKLLENLCAKVEDEKADAIFFCLIWVFLIGIIFGVGFGQHPFIGTELWDQMKHNFIYSGDYWSIVLAPVAGVAGVVIKRALEAPTTKIFPRAWIYRRQ